MYQNVGQTFNIPVSGRAQPEINDHHNAFFTTIVDSVYDVYGPSTAEMEIELCVLEDKMKAIQGSSVFGLDDADMWSVPSVKIPAKFKVHDFENYKGVNCLKTHIRSFCRKMVAHSEDEKLFMYFCIHSLVFVNLFSNIRCHTLKFALPFTLIL